MPNAGKTTAAQAGRPPFVQSGEAVRIRLPLVVDLDGTLIHSDLIWEALVLFFKTQFFNVWRLPLWLFKGKAAFKRRLADAVTLDAAALPYDRALVSHIAAEREQGRTVVLATGSDHRFAIKVAQHLKLFDHVVATEADVNMTSTNKGSALVKLYGEYGFDYVGNAHADLAVWQRCRHAFSVTAKPFHLADGRITGKLGDIRKGWGAALIIAMRPRQWLKNLLVFVPMLAGHAINQATVLQSVVTFVAFSLCASSAYLLNDALDAQDDRVHQTKRHRPIAAGTLPLPVAMCSSLLLAVSALGLSTVFDPLLLLVVAIYFTTTVTYSMFLKRLLMVDIVTLSILYSLRILGGCASTHIAPSFWLLTFSFFLFLSLALLKRHSELFNLQSQGHEKTHGRGYTTADKAPVGIMGINAAFMSVVIFMLYIDSANVHLMYAQPAWLAGIMPLLVFWLGRLWTLSFRGKVNEDPVLYVSKDPLSLSVFAVCLALAVAASL